MRQTSGNRRRKPMRVTVSTVCKVIQKAKTANGMSVKSIRRVLSSKNDGRSTWPSLSSVQLAVDRAVRQEYILRPEGWKGFRLRTGKAKFQGGKGAKGAGKGRKPLKAKKGARGRKPTTSGKGGRGRGRPPKGKDKKGKSGRGGVNNNRANTTQNAESGAQEEGASSIWRFCPTSVCVIQ